MSDSRPSQTQAILNIAERLDAQDEDSTAFSSGDEPPDWRKSNERIAALLVANDLRIADANDTFANALPRLQDLGFDTASLQQGYGRALDFVLDGVIASFANLNGPLGRVLDR